MTSSRCHSATRDLAVGGLDDFGAFPDGLVPDSGVGDPFDAGVGGDLAVGVDDGGDRGAGGAGGEDGGRDGEDDDVAVEGGEVAGEGGGGGWRRGC